MLSKAGPLSFIQGNQGIGRSLDARMERRLGVANRQGRPVRVALHRDQATGGLNREVGGGPVCPWAGLPVWRHGDIDQLGSVRVQVCESKAERRHRARVG